jgi:HK97 family phage major capsid protein
MATNRRNSLVQTAEAILDTAKRENRNLSEAERRDFDGLMKKVDGIDAGSTRGIEDDDAELQRRLAPPGELTREQMQKLMGGAPRIPADYEGRSGFSERAGERFGSLGEFLQSVIAAGTRGGQTDPRLYQQRAALGMSEGLGSSAGFAVGSDFSQELLAGVMAEATLASRCRQFAISGNSNSIKLPAPKTTNQTSGNRWGGISLGWANEAGTLSVSKPSIRLLELSLQKLGGVSYLTSELVEDGAALAQFVQMSFASEFAWELDSAIYRGTGAGTPLGILNSPALVTIAKETNQIADTIVAENVMKMYSAMPENSLKDAVWLINSSCWPQIFQFKLLTKNVAGTENVSGSPLFNPANGISGAPFGTLFGRPILPVPQCSALGDLGDIAFVNLRNYLLAQKSGVQSAASIHVAFLTDELALRWVLRVGGQPYLDAPITPAYGSANSKSDFVVLAGRA